MVGDPRDLYESPPTPFVASFLGRSIELPVSVVDDDPPRIEVAGQAISVSDVSQPPETTLRCYLRPSSLSIRQPREGEFGLSGTVQRVSDRGRQYVVTVRTPTDVDVAIEQQAAPPEVGASVTVAVPTDGLHLF